MAFFAEASNGSPAFQTLQREARVSFVIMWRHGEQYPRLHISSVPLAAFWQDGFDPTQWTICLFWEPSDWSQPDEPSPDTKMTPNDNDETPAYSDPNVPIRPPPGLGQPDVDMPRPDEEMPAVPNSPQPPDDPPPPGAGEERSRSREREREGNNPRHFHSQLRPVINHQGRHLEEEAGHAKNSQGCPTIDHQSRRLETM